MSRNLADLKIECEANGLVVTMAGKKEAKSDYETALRDFYWNKTNPGKELPEQIEPMLARNAKDETEEFRVEAMADGGQWVAQEKINGCRCLLHILHGEANRLTSRRLSDETYRFNELTDKMPHYRDLDLGPDWHDTVIDGEVLAPVHVIDTRIHDGKGQLTVDILQATAATMNCDPEKSIAIQNRYGKLVLHVFDCLRYKGKDVRNLPYVVLTPEGEMDMTKPSRYLYAMEAVQAVLGKLGDLPCQHCTGERPTSLDETLGPQPGCEQEDFMSILTGD